MTSRALTIGSALWLVGSSLACSTLPSAESSKIQHTTVKEGRDSPEISRSVGEEGGVVVLWPRIIPRSEDPETIAIAEKVQSELAAAAGRALPDRPKDRRPQPERVCPKAGCKAMHVGAVVTRKGDGCAVMATVGGSGTTPVKLVAWGGTVDVMQDIAQFRDPPENQMRVIEYAPCDALAESMAERNADVEAAMKDVALAE